MVIGKSPKSLKYRYHQRLDCQSTHVPTKIVFFFHPSKKGVYSFNPFSPIVQNRYLCKQLVTSCLILIYTVCYSVRFDNVLDCTAEMVNIVRLPRHMEAMPEKISYILLITIAWEDICILFMCKYQHGLTLIQIVEVTSLNWPQARLVTHPASKHPFPA